MNHGPPSASPRLENLSANLLLAAGPTTSGLGNANPISVIDLHAGASPVLAANA